MNKNKIKDIRIADLEEAYKSIKKSGEDIITKELTAIKNAIDYIKENEM